MSSASSQAHARALVRQARAAAESGGTGGPSAPTTIRGVAICTPIPGVTDAVICVLCKKRVKTGRMWAIHSKTPQHQHLVQRLQLALVSQESKPAATETEDNEQHADKGVEGKNEEKSGLLSAGYGDDDDNESSGESEVDDGKIQNRPETPPADDVVVPPPRKETEMEAVGPIPANEDLLDSDDIRNYVTAELAGLVVSGTVYEYENGETGEPAKGKRKRRPMKKKKSLGTSALPEGFFDDEDKAAEVFGREAPSKRRDKDMQIDMKKLELQLDAGDRRQLVEGNTRIEEDSDIITDEYVRSLHHDQEDRERHLSELRDKRRRVHDRHELHLPPPPPTDQSSVVDDTESSSEEEIQQEELPSKSAATPEVPAASNDDDSEEEDFDEDDFASNWRSKSM